MSSKAQSSRNLSKKSLEVIENYEDDFEEYEDSDDIFKQLGIEEDVRNNLK